MYLLLNFLAKILATSSPTYLTKKLLFRTKAHIIPVRDNKLLTIPNIRQPCFNVPFHVKDQSSLIP
nr:unnamed protein product [Callosobruchus analis]